MGDTSSKPDAGAGEVRIRLTFAGKQAVFKMLDNATSKALVAQLPLTVTLSDYAGTEKVANLPNKLSTQGAPSGYDPSVGDLTYYAPWGNLAIFYKDFGYAQGLVPLGAVESGLSDLAALGQDLTATIEIIKSKDAGLR